jgi:hypothetical protein
MSEQEKNPAEVQPNTENAEVQTNTITQDQFNAYVQSKGLKVFEENDFNTLKDNLLKEGSQKSFNSAFGKGLDKAKEEIAKKYNLELNEDSKFSDVLGMIETNKSNDNDVELLRNKLKETETSYKKQLEELQQGYKTKEFESLFNSLWLNISSRIDAAEEHKEKYKNIAFVAAKNSLDFSGEVVKNGEYEYKNELREPLPKVKALEAFISDYIPLKTTKPIKQGNGMNAELNGSNSWLNSVKSFDEVVKITREKGLSQKEATKLQADWYAANLKKK